MDSERILGKLLENNIHITLNLEEARSIIINTCAFLQSARSESEEVIQEFIEKKKAGIIKKLIVSGCYPSLDGSSLMDRFPEIDAITGTNDINHIVDALKLDRKGQFLSRDFELVLPSRFLVTLPHYAYLKIADGCSHRCAFCLIPNIKGNLHSFEREFIIQEAEGLVNNGVKEIIITAQDTTNYGADIYGKSMFIPLLEDLEKIKGIEWIRVLYTYPGEVTEDLVSYIRNSEKVVPYIDMPIQHINDTILKNMNRIGQRKDIEKIVGLFKKNNIAVRTTLIVGFPGEGEKEFEELREFVEEMKFDHLGVFKYFREEGTKSYNMENQVEEAVKERREKTIKAIQEKISLNRNKTFIGRTIPVIIDYYDEKKGVFVGRTKYDAPEVDNIVLAKGAVTVGEIQDIVVENVKEHALIGRVL